MTVVPMSRSSLPFLFYDEAAAYLFLASIGPVRACDIYESRPAHEEGHECQDIPPRYSLGTRGHWIKSDQRVPIVNLPKIVTTAERALEESVSFLQRALGALWVPSENR